MAMSNIICVGDVFLHTMLSESSSTASYIGWVMAKQVTQEFVDFTPLLNESFDSYEYTFTKPILATSGLTNPSDIRVKKESFESDKQKFKYVPPEHFNDFHAVQVL